MKKRRMKLLALALTVCVGASSVPSVWASGTDMPAMEKSEEFILEDSSLAGFQAEELPEVKETGEAEEEAPEVETDGEQTDASAQEKPDGTGEDTAEESTGGELLGDTIKSVLLGKDAVWQEVDGSVTVPADTVNKRLYLADDGHASLTYVKDDIIEVRTEDGESYLYAFDENGLIRTGIEEIDGDTYFFILKNMVEESESDLCPQTGRAQKDYWLNQEADNLYGREWIYFGEDGKQTTEPFGNLPSYELGTDAVWQQDPKDPGAPDGGQMYRLYRVHDGKVTNRYLNAWDDLVQVEKENGETASYLFGPDGEILTGVQGEEDTMRQWYFTTAEEAGSEDPSAGDYGAMKKDLWVLGKDGTAWYYFGEDGLRVQREGYQEINGAHYYLKADGTIVTGYQEVEGVLRYFSPKTDPIGQETDAADMVQGWVKDGDAWRYVKEDGTIEIRTGIQKIQSGTLNAWMCLDKNGVPMKNTAQKYSKNGKWYYFGEDGIRVTSSFGEYKGRNYYFGKTGTRANYKNVWKTIDGKKYYFGAGYYTVKKTGWQKIGSYWYYFSSNGVMQKNKWITENGKKYYVNSNGVMYGGLRKIDGYYYYFKWSSGNNRYGYALTNRWVKTKGYWYYADSNGRMKKGWITVNGNQYYLDSNCRLVTNKWCTKNGVRGYVDSDGVFRKANTWVNVDGHWRYLKDGAKNGWATGWTRIDGYKYYFKSNGDMQTDLSGMAGFTQGPYRYDVNRQTCNVTVLGKDENGEYKVPVIAFACSVGLPSTPTPLGGPYTMQKEGRWQLLMGPSWGQYGTHLIGAGQGGIYFHSVAGSAANHYSISAVEYNKLGSPASHGCIRLTVRDAKWIWDHWGSGGNTAYIHDSATNIFYKPSVPKISAGTTYDPTDPAI